MKNFFTLLFVAFSFIGLYGQGSTTSSVRGQIVDDQNQELIGANIIATHTPSGTTYGTVTDLGGYYYISNMRVGGPYTITVSYTGFAEQVSTDVYLRLGETFKKNYVLQEAAIDLTGVTVKATRTNAGENAGASTQISAEQIENMPTLNRDLNDFTRLTPQARGAFGGGLSIAGINNRYNAIYIDGAVNNDVFGLSSQGTNGGQTGISPVSIDVIDQLQVVISPYDVSQGGFAGGGINAVTKSGTNEFSGTAYYFLQNENLVGATNRTQVKRDGLSRAVKLDDFKQQTYGASLGGPIIKDKLFFFTNVEIQDDGTPAPFEIENYDGDASVEQLDQLSNFLRSQYGYDPGGYGNKIDKLEGFKFFGKLNYNINENHKLVLRHQYTKAENTDVNGSNFRNINFANNGVFFPSTTNSSALELNSVFGKISNNLIVGYTTVRDDRDPIGGDFPAVRIDDGGGTIWFGSEAFSSANQLDTDVLSITDNLKIYKGAHTLTIGTHNEFSKFYNLFIPRNFGAYRYGSLDDFLQNAGATEYDRTYSLVDDITGDGSAAAAEFDAMQLGFYVQDEWQVNNNFTLTAGLRLDIPVLTSDPQIDPSFNSTTLPLLEAAGYDLGGTVGGEAPSGQLMWSPRVGFNYDLSEATTIRGGLGVFTSRVPFVWPGAMYNNNGVSLGNVNENDLQEPISFISDVNNQYENPNFSVPSGQIDLFTKDFKFPQLFRTSLAADHNFGNGLRGTVEGIFSKTLNNVIYKNINDDPTVNFNWTNGANNTDDRPVFTRSSLDPTYSAIYLGENTSEGYTYSITGSLTKNFTSGLYASLAYTFGEAESLIEGTSSQNSSQWRGGFHVDGRNDPAYGPSDFGIGHRIVGSLNYAIDYDEEKKARLLFSVFYNGQSGDPYSYVYRNGVNGTRADNINNQRGSTSRNRSLIYVPASQSDILLLDIVDSDGNVTLSAAEQWAALDKFIAEDDHLSERRGDYAEKNGARSPFSHQIDVRVTQEFTVGKNKLQLTVDVFNFANVLNAKWGVQYINPFDYQVINFEGYAADGTTPQFTFTEEDLGNDRFAINNRFSRYSARLGIRYIFN